MDANLEQAVERVRRSIAAGIRSRVVGPGAPERASAIFEAPGPRWFDPGRPVRRVHADSSMFVGGMRALLLQSLHPLAMAGVADHSDFREDPWGRLQRTSEFLARTTFGPVEQAEAACRTVREVHRHVVGTAPDGRRYAANDPHLLRWVHVAEVDSFLGAHQRFGRAPLDAAGCDGYVADMAVVARALGVLDPPTTIEALRLDLAAFRPELEATPEAREAARFLLGPPRLPLLARPAYGVLAASAVGLLPLWARLALRLPMGPMTDTLVVRPAGTALMQLTRWALASAPARRTA